MEVKNNIRKAVISLTGLTLAMSLLGCSTQEVEAPKTIEYHVKRILPDEDTVNIQTPSTSSDTGNNKKNDDDNTYTTERHNYSNNVNELQLVGDYASIGYEIKGQNVEYQGTVYESLYSTVNQLSSPYSTEAMIKFIVETMNSTQNTVYCEVVDFTQDGDYGLGVESIMGDYAGYTQYRNKYNRDVEWSLDIFERDNTRRMVIYGCSDYLLCASLDGLWRFDTEKMPSGVEKLRSYAPVYYKHEKSIPTQLEAIPQDETDSGAVEGVIEESMVGEVESVAEESESITEPVENIEGSE